MERIEINKDIFLAFMDRIIDRFDMLDKKIEKMEKGKNILDGDRLLDNQDLSQLLNVSYRTLQRYRSSKKLPSYFISGKRYYKESDVHMFIRNHLKE